MTLHPSTWQTPTPRDTRMSMRDARHQASRHDYFKGEAKTKAGADLEATAEAKQQNAKAQQELAFTLAAISGYQKKAKATATAKTGAKATAKTGAKATAKTGAKAKKQ